MALSAASFVAKVTNPLPEKKDSYLEKSKMSVRTFRDKVYIASYLNREYFTELLENLG